MDQRARKKIIFHIDVNSAFLSWEAVYRIYHLGASKDLREQVCAVGGDMALRHGIILAKSIPAKKYGIHTGESIVEAKRKCPGLILVPPNYSLYERCSAAFMDILREYSDIVEQYSIDEAFLDYTQMEPLYGNPVQAAQKIREHIREKLGFTVNIGVSENKLLAKMASDFTKPDRVHTLFLHEVPAKMWPLPVSELFFVGRATTKKLWNLGIQTIGDLARSDPDLLRSHLKKHGEMIWNFANGRDVSVVQAVPPANKGYGNSTTIAFDVNDRSVAGLVLLGLSETIAFRLRKASVKAEVISVGIKYDTLDHESCQMTLDNATDITMEIHHYACQLFDRLWDGRPIRHLGIHTGKLCDSNIMRQLNMFDCADYDKFRCMDETIDHIRQQFGMDAVKRASFINSPIDHLSGGISREKRAVDYKKIRIE